MKLALALLSALAVAASAHPRRKEIVLREGDVNPVTGEALPIRCGTQEVYEFRKRVLNDTTPFTAAAGCDIAKCDNPQTRDGTSTAGTTIRIAFTVINDVMTETELNAAISAFEKRFEDSNINFHVVTRNFANDTRYGVCIPPYGNSDDWFYAIAALKSTHAYKPEKVLNVFVTCQASSSMGTLLGIATFPWDTTALTATGGLWMNSVAMTPDDDTLAHETGHCLGLWHTFHGTTEVSLCNSNVLCGRTCCEHPHPSSEATGNSYNQVGDFCSDTKATTMEYLCTKEPAGAACDGTKWSEYGVPYNNYMGYAMVNPATGATEHCQDHFTKQQIRRMHCFLNDEIKAFTCSGNDCNV